MNHLCGIRLSTVSIVAGWFNLIGAIFLTILLIVAFARLDEFVQMIEEQMNDPNKEEIRAAIIIGLSVYLTVYLAKVFASAMLIVGTVKERHLLLTPWLINKFIHIFVNVLYLNYIIFVSIPDSIPIGSIVGAVIGAGLILAFQCTIWNAIYSLYKQLRANSDVQQRLLASTSNNSYTN